MEQEIVVERLGEMVVALEAAVARLSGVTAGEPGAACIVATAASAREEELERKLVEAEEKVTRLEAAASSGGRKTASVGLMFARESGEVSLSAALDGALGSLSVEQRIAVKAELMRAGVV